MSLQKRCIGDPNVKFFEDPEVIALFDPVRQWLSRNCRKNIPDETLSNSHLSRLALQMLQFQEDYFGVKLADPGPKIPFHVFHDTATGGGLCRLLSAAYRFRRDQGWERLPLSSPYSEAVQQKLAEMWRKLYHTLDIRGVWSRPIVHLSDSIDQNQCERLTIIVQKLGGRLVAAKSEASHIVYPAVPSSDDEREEVRVVLRAGYGCLLHWRYTAETQQLWTYGVSQDPNLRLLEPAPRPPTACPWEVDARWLLNSHSYGEWAPEEDYIMDYQPYTLSRGVQPVACRRHFSISELTVPYSGATLSGPRPELFSPTPVKKRRRPTSPTSSTSSSKRRASSAVKKSVTESTTVKKTKRTKEPRTVSPLPEADTNIISDITLILPDPPSSTLVTEVDMLDPIAAAMSQFIGRSYYVRNQSTKGEPRGTLNQLDSADAISDSDSNNEDDDDDTVTLSQPPSCLLIPSHASWFDQSCVHDLERQSIPEFFQKNDESKLYMAYRNLIIDTYRISPETNLTFSTIRRQFPEGDVASLMRIFNMLTHWGLINTQLLCNSDVWQDSKASLVQPLHILNESEDADGWKLKTNLENSEKHIMNVTDPEDNMQEVTNDFGLNFDDAPAASKPTGSFQSRSGQSMSSREWNDAETLSLLEAVERHGDDWNRIADHVGTRCQDECILRMLRLPIEDPYLEGDPRVMTGPVQHLDTPFGQTGNPVMATIAFIANSLSPLVASSSAKAAIREYCLILSKVKSEYQERNKQKTTENSGDNTSTGNSTSEDDVNKSTKISLDEEAAKLTAHPQDGISEKQPSIETMIDLTREGSSPASTEAQYSENPSISSNDNPSTSTNKNPSISTNENPLSTNESLSLASTNPLISNNTNSQALTNDNIPSFSSKKNSPLLLPKENLETPSSSILIKKEAEFNSDRNEVDKPTILKQESESVLINSKEASSTNVYQESESVSINNKEASSSNVKKESELISINSKEASSTYVNQESEPVSINSKEASSTNVNQESEPVSINSKEASSTNVNQESEPVSINSKEASSTNVNQESESVSINSKEASSTNVNQESESVSINSKEASSTNVNQESESVSINSKEASSTNVNQESESVSINSKEASSTNVNQESESVSINSKEASLTNVKQESVSSTDPDKESESSSSHDTHRIADKSKTDAVVAAALEAAKEKAHQLAQVEERKLRALMLQLLDLQVKRVELKVKVVQEIEAARDRELQRAMQQRDVIFAERKQFHAELLQDIESRSGVTSEDRLINQDDAAL